MNKEQQTNYIADTNKMVTAVEWLRDEWLKRDIDTSIKELFQQAKAMEKEQLFEFWNGGINCTEEKGKDFEQYYNEKYGK